MQAMEKLGLDMAISKTAETVEEARVIARDLIGGFPIIVRPAYTLGGTGGGIAYNQNEFETIVAAGLDASMTSQVWKLAHTRLARTCETSLHNLMSAQLRSAAARCAHSC
jgi:carbamoylphosphate synthase large subunit